MVAVAVGALAAGADVAGGVAEEVLDSAHTAGADVRAEGSLVQLGMALGIGVDKASVEKTYDDLHVEDGTGVASGAGDVEESGLSSMTVTAVADKTVDEVTADASPDLVGGVEVKAHRD